MTDNRTAPPDGQRRGRPGRPRATEAERRDLAVRVRVSPGELAILHKSAQAAGLAVSSYLRGVGLRHRVRPARSPLDLRLLGELNRLGNNFNQFLILTYTHRAPDALAPTVESLRLLLESILAALSGESSREESP